MAHYRSFSYNFEEYSVKDIEEYVKSIGLEIERSKNAVFTVSGTSIDVRLPLITSLLRTNFSSTFSLSGDVFWNTYDDLYYIPGTARLPESLGERDQALLKKHEKIFNALKRKFQMKKGEHPKAIKDLEWIQSFEKKDKKLWPFEK